MVLLSGEQWNGSLRFDDSTQTDADGSAQATGLIDGYAWYFQSKNGSFFVEIAEDQGLTGDDLPLVGYGCGGWVYECEEATFPSNKSDFSQYVNKQLSSVFTLFLLNKLNYLPDVSCPCSE